MFLLRPILEAPGGLRATLVAACVMVGTLRAAQTFLDQRD